MPRRAALLAFLVLCAASSLSGADVDAFQVLSGRDIARGGLHAALADDSGVLFSNPAGLVAAPPSVSFSRLGLTASGPVFDIADAVIGGSEPVAAISDVLANNDYKLFTGLDIGGPISFSYVGGGLGFGFFNTTSVSLDAASLTAIKIRAAEDLFLVGGYAFRLELGGGHNLDLGFAAKGFVRGAVLSTKTLFEVESILSDPLTLLDEPFTLTTGVGIDLGLRWSWRGLAAGLVCRDAYSPAIVTEYSSASGFISDPAAAKIGNGDYAVIEPDLAVGLAWRPELGRLGQYMDDLLLCVDYADILDLARPIPRNAILNLRLGIETRVLEILSLRVGINDALLAAGVGIDFGLMRMDFAAYGNELGIEPGERSNYNLLVSFEFAY